MLDAVFLGVHHRGCRQAPLSGQRFAKLLARLCRVGAPRRRDRQRRANQLQRDVGQPCSGLMTRLCAGRGVPLGIKPETRHVGRCQSMRRGGEATLEGDREVVLDALMVWRCESEPARVSES